MSNPLIKAVVTTLIQVVLIFDHHNVQAEFSDTCDNSASSLSCIHTYEQLYHSLTKSDNSFNIESALFPAKRPSSVRVFVNLHGPNKTGSPIARYTWSVSCLYVAIPDVFLEIVSLGSILVRHRTKELNLTIPHFCCNVSKTEDERKKTINDMIENVLAALQDLASSPGIRNPELNNAECVIEGHGTDMQATGRSLEIRIMIWGSFCSTCAAFDPLYGMIVGYVVLLKVTNSPEYKAMLCLSVLVGVPGSFIWLILLSVVIYFSVRDGPLFYLDILLVLIPVLYFITPLSKRVRDIWNNFRSSDPGQMNSGFMWFQKLLAPLSVIYTCFFSCWMLIGIMLNPIWGLTIALALCLVISSFNYIVGGYVGTRKTQFDESIHPSLRRNWVLSFLALIFSTIVVIFAGQSFNGRETADGIFKAVLFTALFFFTSWLSWKRLFSQKSERREAPTTNLPDPLTHLCQILSQHAEPGLNFRGTSPHNSFPESMEEPQPSFGDFDKSSSDHSIDSWV